MISKSTILNYDDNDSFDDYDVEVIVTSIRIVNFVECPTTGSLIVA